MNELLFDKENVKTIADNLKIKVEELNTVLKNMKTNLSDVKKVWSSNAQDSVSEKLNTFFKNTEELSAKSLVYVEFLNKVISEYDKADTPANGGE